MEIKLKDQNSGGEGLIYNNKLKWPTIVVDRNGLC